LAATIKQLVRRSNLTSRPWTEWVLAAIEFLAVYALAWRGGLWVLAAVLIVAIELRLLLPGSKASENGKTMAFWQCLPGLVMGLSVTLIVAMVPRHATQVAVALLYAGWLAWRERDPDRVSNNLAQLLIIQAVMFEAIFLVAAVWHNPDGTSIPAWITLVLVWAGAYFTVYGVLTRRGDKSAGVMAATWGVIATEVAWVLMLWLITYTMTGGFVLVPQPALILTALAYIFGSILVSSRHGNLSRGRLGEYMVIALVLVMIVIVGTSWRGNV
jgi:hypothetical protein